MPKLTDEWGFFTPIPEVVIEAWPELGLDAVALFVYLRFRKNRWRGMSWPSYNDIHEGTTLSLKRIAAAIKVLEEHDFLTVKSRFGKPNEYVLHPPALGVPSSSSVTGTEMDITDQSVLPQVQTSSVAGTDDLRLSNQDSQEQDQGLARSQKTRARDPLFDAICEVCKVDPKTAGASIGKVKTVLTKAEYTPEDVVRFGRQWRGRRPPTLWQLQQQIGVVRSTGNRDEQVRKESTV